MNFYYYLSVDPNSCVATDRSWWACYGTGGHMVHDHFSGNFYNAVTDDFGNLVRVP